MTRRDPRIDAYVKKSAPFARPILAHLRAVVHEACPTVEETVKWGAPSFEHKGLLCGMAAFKAHCTFGFWKHSLVVGEEERASEAMGSFGRLTSVEDLPGKAELKRLIKRAVELNEQGIKVERPKRAPRKALPLPPELKAALAKDAAARRIFEAFSPSHRREYAEWIGEAKGADTRARRLAQAMGWIRAGKHRNWKYERRSSR
jgi:uncharacterized protein YdeI (YjbR/CyaY-like superfamily)